MGAPAFLTFSAAADTDRSRFWIDPVDATRASAPREGSPNPKPMRILFITSTRIGDAVLSSGVLGRLQRLYPGARLTIVCGPAVAPLFTHVPNLEKIVPFQRRRWLGHWFALWGDCVTRYWTVVVDLRRSALVYLVLAGRRYRMSHDRPGVHKVRQLAESVGFADAPAPEIHAGPEHRQAAAALIPAGGPVLALGPTANWGGKQWAAERFRSLIDRLTGAGGVLPGARVAVFSAPDERAAAIQVLADVADDRRLDLAGRTDLLTAYACLERCDLYIGNDSGLMHLAAAAGVPTLGLFGPSREEHYGPWGPFSRAVRTTQSYDEIVGAPDYDYRSQATRMDSLSVDAVVAAVEDLMAAVAAAGPGERRAAFR